MYRSALALMFAVLALQPALAQGDAPAGRLNLELNAIQSVQAGCRVTFLATNDLPAAIDRAAVEMAFFVQDGSIERIVTLDFKALSPGKTKVLQFELTDLACADIRRLLVNDITACDGVGLVPADCLGALATSSRPDITFGV